MLNSLLTPSVSTPPALREAAPAPYRDHSATTVSHVFATPVVREVRRPAQEPAAFATIW